MQEALTTGRPFPGIAGDVLADALREFAIHQRWFRSKARNVRAGRVRDAIPVPGTDCALVLLDIEYEEGDADTYAFPVYLAEGSVRDGLIATLANEGATLADALWNRKFTDALLEAIGQERDLDGRHGRLTAFHTVAFDRIVGGGNLQLTAKVSKAEQTNSSVFYGDRFILKLYRKLEAGINPDFEIGRFLTERGFQHTPAVAGHIEYRADASQPMPVCILQQFVPNRGDAWEYTLGAAGEYFNRTALHSSPPELTAQHPMASMPPGTPAATLELIGDYIRSARILGQRTAQMHIALTAAGGDPDFEPEPFTDEFRDRLHKTLLAQADLTVGLIRDKQHVLTGRAAEDARRLLDLKPRIREIFRQVCENRIHAVRIRHHGDYHLGQVLYTGDDFFIIDFEGEPARSLADRRMKRAAMRDVAGMIRSFQYAAYSALRKRENVIENGEGWAAAWTAWVSRAFAAAYFELADGHPFLPDDKGERKLLLDIFLLEKALYEVAYELNNRPGWVGIPLRGIVSVIG